MKDLGRAGPTKVEGALYAPDRGAIYMSRRLVRTIVGSGIVSVADSCLGLEQFIPARGVAR